VTAPVRPFCRGPLVLLKALLFSDRKIPLFFFLFGLLMTPRDRVNPLHRTFFSPFTGPPCSELFLGSAPLHVPTLQCGPHTLSSQPSSPSPSSCSIFGSPTGPLDLPQLFGSVNPSPPSHQRERNTSSAAPRIPQTPVFFANPGPVTLFSFPSGILRYGGRCAEIALLKCVISR